MTVLKTALFVDFDNVYLSLKRADSRAAEAFASTPHLWLKWIEDGMAGDEATEGEAGCRRILIRRCYLNPRSFHKYRPFFVRAAFEVIDCPPLTNQGKTSADLRMAMDILDALAHETRFDEFMLLSGDADFTPLLMRLRSHDRRTTVLAIGFAAEAYKAACDLVVPENSFIEAGLHIVDEESVEALPGKAAPNDHLSVASRADGQKTPDREETLATMTGMVVEKARKGPVSPRIAVQIFRRCPAFERSKDWLGFGTLRALAEEVARRHPGLTVTEGSQWNIVLAGTSRPSNQTATPEDVAKRHRETIVGWVEEVVRNSPTPIPLARMGLLVREEFGDLLADGRWLGAKTFKHLLLSVPDVGFVLEGPNGVLRDPSVHPAGDPHSLSPIRALARQLGQVTGIPTLSPSTYVAVFESVAEYLYTNPFQLHSASRAVASLLNARSFDVSRLAAEFVLRGIADGGAPLAEAPRTFVPRELATSFRNKARELCANADISLSEEELGLLDAWLLDEPAPIS